MINANELSPIVNALEEQEAKLLSWGDTGGTFSELELQSICEQILPEEEFDDVLDALEQQAMIYSIFDSSGRNTGYRSRMAHAVHLYRSLRQWMHGQPLNNSRTLVSDFRFLRRPRSYPIRDKVISDLLQEWKVAKLVRPLIDESIRAQVGTFNLSGFQQRATERILQAWPRHRTRVTHSSATIVCSGTGSGKSLAFYLPALSSLVSDLSSDNSARVRILAIYPRNELLKDQFNETYLASRQLDAICQSGAGRKIRIGALFGGIPENSRKAAEKEHFRKTGIVKCPSGDCHGEMRWNSEDVERSYEQLTCSLCGSIIGNDEVMLTRSAMENSPPDILFTTTEMLNQQMGRPGRQHLFGIKTSKPIPLVLLDEVHTYGGNQGAQTAFLLRRWMALAKTSPHFVGLSATLSDAEKFFSRLTGTNPSRVRLVEPLMEEMTEEGAEYLVALRGDPVSQTALLSTTIQASMLTRRILDNCQRKPSQGLWGSKTFIFTDDLDVTNRLYSQLADAEGWWQRGTNLTPNRNGPLAKLRNPNEVDAPSKRELSLLGQDWSALQHNGFSLDRNDRAKVSRTSSQDSGVLIDSDVVVATAALEVGYNDPDVGAVIQHKSPRGVASYIQRKGRAGRTRMMRPWMIAILSDFGRDRETYQSYEKLLDPEIKLQGLPINNSHIQRMQAAMTTLNWLELKLADVHLWTKLNFPERNGRLDPKLSLLHEAIEDAMQPGIVQDELADYLQKSMQLSDRDTASVLWQPPRSILMEFLPTLRRRIRTLWGKWDEQNGVVRDWAEANSTWRSPVPEFIPDQLFSELNLPTVDIFLDRGPAGIVTEGMSFFQALKEFAPGRLSKRFSVRSGQSSDWVIPVDYFPTEVDDGTTQVVDVGRVYGTNIAGIGQFTLPSGESVRVLKPYQITTNALFNNQDISDTSNAFLKWHSDFELVEQPEQHFTPSASLWDGTLDYIDFCTHRSMTPVNVTRFTTESTAEFKFKRTGKKSSVKFLWQEDGEPVAIGVSQSVDGIKVHFQLDKTDLLDWLADEDLLASLRTNYFQDRLRNSPLVNGNEFTADWLFECFLAALLADISRSGSTIKEAIVNVANNLCALKIADMPYALFQKNSADADAVETSDEPELADQSLQRDLVDILGQREVIEGVSELAASLHGDITNDSQFLQWCFTVLGNTLSAALKQTIAVLLPDADDRSLLVDPDFDVSKRQHYIWLTEEDSGGTGIITQLQDLHAEDPLQFLNSFAQQVQGGEYEQLDADLVSLLLGYESNAVVQSAFASIRNANTLGDRIVANKTLRQTLTSAGFHFSHSFASVLHSRILKPGSSESTDRKLAEYLLQWQTLEDRVALELPINTVSFVIAYAAQKGGQDIGRLYKETCAIQAVLWPRGGQLRQSALSFYNPFKFQGNNRTERKLAAKLCLDTTETVIYTASCWHDELHKLLPKYGRVNLLVPSEAFGELNNIIAALHTRAIDTHGLLVYPRIVKIEHKGRNIIVRIEIAESVF